MNRIKMAVVCILIVVLAGFLFLQKAGTDKTSAIASNLNSRHKQKPAAKSAETEIVKETDVSQKLSDNKTVVPGPDNSTRLNAEFEKLMANLLIADDAELKRAVAEVLDSIRDNLGEIETMQGFVSVTVDGEPPVINADFHINRSDRENSQMTSVPFKYAVKIRDEKKQLNLLTADSQKVQPQIWFDSDVAGEGNEQLLPPMLSLQLPNILLAPVSAMLGAYKESGRPQETRTGFLQDRILTIHKSRPEEEQGLQGGPFWIVQTLGQGTFWLSEKGEFCRLVKNKGKNKLDISYSKHELINGIQYPTQISINLAMEGIRGEQFVKAFTGKTAKVARIKISLKNIQINNLIDESKFQRDEK